MKSSFKKMGNNRKSKNRDENLNIETKLKLNGRSAIDNLIKTVALVAAFFTPVSGFAAAVTPMPFYGAGTPTVNNVKEICNLPSVSQPGSPVMLTVNNPTIPSGVYQQGLFKVSLNITNSGKNLAFQDVSENTDPQYYDSSGSSQFLGTRGIEAVWVRSGGGTNVYCYVDKLNDFDLIAGGNNITSVGVVWVKGPCGLPNQSALDAVCQAYNPTADTVDLLDASQRTHFGEQKSESPVNICGCNGSVPRFCDPAVPVGEPGSCNATSDAVSGVSSTDVIYTGDGTCGMVKRNGTYVYSCW